ncbi:MAG TPA: phenylalanine--tRNA ligase subunit beta [Candidatus Paceibacterota bacterium]
MKISTTWLQKYFNTPLPNAEILGDALTFHAFEIDGIEKVGSDEVLDVKVTPNRGHDCLSHRGIAKELSAILQIPLASDPFMDKSDLSKTTDAVSISINTSLCRRYSAGYIQGVKVGPSPQWLVERLASMGQRSINNVVDATNFVMFDVGQPLHAFDAGKLEAKDGKYAIEIRAAHDGEKMLALDNKEYTLKSSNLMIVDAHAGVPIGIAGVKGGVPAAINEETVDIIVESANFDGASIRKTAQALKLRTDASVRFEQAISSQIAGHAMRAAVDLILSIAGGEVIGFVDVYPAPQQQTYVAVTTEKINQVLGTNLTDADVASVFARLGLAYKEEAGVFEVQPSCERLDLEIAEDLVEEVARIIGYDKILPVSLDAARGKTSVNKNFYSAEKVREELVSKGYSEVFTSVFSDKGERIVANKVDGVKPFLRDSLLPSLTEALDKNKHSKELLELKEIKLFEIGTVWKDGKEIIMLGTISEKEPAKEQTLENLEEKGLPAAYEHLPLSTAARYQPFSKYPYIVRDIAMWAPAGIHTDEVEKVIKKEGGELCVKSYLFDTFEKEDKKSLAYRLIFQAFDRTLTEQEVNQSMAHISAILGDRGFEIR